MATSRVSEVLGHLRRAVLLRGEAGLTDGQLLEDYLSRRDEAALAALVRRHGPMVWGVCRRVLHNHHDAEDAFQATFLVLVRRAASIASQELLANWLYGVAHQTALKARATAARRKVRERQVAVMPEPAVAGQDVWDDLRPLLDQELSRLPDHYRGVLVLCDLEGMTRKEAAQQLGIPEGSVASRLARARGLLAKRLTRRGLFSGGSVAAVLSAGSASASAPPALVASTIKTASLLAAGQARATGVISARVAALTEGVVKAMFVTRIKGVLGMVLVVAALAGAAGLIYQTQAADQPRAKGVRPPRKDSKNDEKDPTKSKEERLRVLIDEVLTAHGGEARLNKLQFTMMVKHSNGETQHYFVQPPKNFRWETTHRDRTGKGIVILFPEGRRWWTKEPNEDAKEFIPLGVEAPLKFWLDYVKFFGPRQVLRLKDADHKVALLDEEARIGDRAAVGVQVTGPLCTQKMYFDKDTHLLLKGVGSDIVREVTFSDYKKFDGIPIAQKEHDGHFEPRVTDFRVVDKFDAKLFEQP